MAIKDILVHVDDTDRGAVRADVALALAAANGAHVTGLGISSIAVMPSFIDAELPPSIIQEQVERQRARVGAAEKAFREKARLAGVDSVEWRVIEQPIGDVTGAAAIHARYADLTIVGQPDPESDTRTISVDLVERLILDAGGPVLVIPYVGRVGAVGKNVMVAWNGSREAARAVRDALPVLGRNAQVTVLSVNPEGGDSAQRDIPGADIAAHLARHGQKVQVQHVTTRDMSVGGVNMSAGDMILSRAADAGSDMIVMGAYGHSRMQEMIFGGATRTVIQHMTVPVLFSH